MRIKWRSVGVAGAVAALLSASITPAVNAAEPAELPEGYYENFDQSGLAAIFVSSEELTGEPAPNGPVAAAVDGSAATYWHSKWQGVSDPAPHTLIFGTTDVPFAGASQLVFTPRGGQGSGRIKDYEVFTSSDAECTVDSSFVSLQEGSVPVTEMGDLTVSFEPQDISCVKMVIESSWDGANVAASFASLAEFNVAKFIEGERPLPDAQPAPDGTAQKDRPLPAGVTSSSEVLDPMALDNRKADNADETPIALKVPSWNGEDRIVGARKSATPAVASLETSGENYFVDCQAESAGADGSKGNPWTSINKVNKHGEFEAGDQILFKRGSVCPGLLHPLGSGVSGDNITIDAYGDVSDPMPRLEGRGISETADSDLPTRLKTDSGKGYESAVVRLFNQEYWTIRNLEITNYTGDTNDYGMRRRGVVIALEDFGRGNGYDISDLYIHDVLGLGEKDLGGSGGIQFEAYAGPAKTPTSFGEIEVHHNTIRHVNRSGINEGSDFRSRHSVGGGINDNPFEVWGAMDVHDNIVSDVGGDAIVTQFASGTEVYNNSVWASANHHDGKSPSGNNAAVWAWDADDVQYYNNHVFDTVMMPGTWDGTAFDSDYGTTGTTFEYNITHDNEGGFMLFCGCGGLSTQTVLRYNMSINDGRGAEDHSSGVRVFFVAGQTDAEVYNNTFLVYPNAAIDAGSSGDSGVTYQNNVFLAQGKVRTDMKPELALNSPFRTNLYGGTEGNWPQPKVNGNTVDAGLTPNGGGGLATVLVDGNIVASKGTPIVKEQSVDLANNDVPLYEKPDLGAFQTGAGSIVAATTALVNGGFENNAAGWDLSESASITSDESRGGENALALETDEATASQSFLAGANRTFRLVASVQADSEGNLPTVTLSNPEEFSAIAAPLDAEGTVEPGEWVNVSATMRTAWDGTDLTVNVAGAGLVDDVAVDIVRDYMVDGSFQSRGNTPWQGGGRTEADSISGGLGASIAPSGTTENVETIVPNVDEDYTLSAWIKGEDLRLGAKLFDGADANKAVTTTSVEFSQYALDITPTAHRFSTFCYNPSAEAGSCDDFTLVKKWDGEVTLIGGDVTDPPVDPTDPVDPVLAAPSGLKSVGATKNSISVSWDEVEGATSYVVSYASVAGIVGTLEVADSSANIKDLTAKTAYEISVQAVNEDETSESSEPITVSTLAEVTDPTDPPVDPTDPPVDPGTDNSNDDDLAETGSVAVPIAVTALIALLLGAVLLTVRKKNA